MIELRFWEGMTRRELAVVFDTSTRVRWRVASGGRSACSARKLGDPGLGLPQDERRVRAVGEELYVSYEAALPSTQRKVGRRVIKT